ncbi:MAG: dihydroorotate dehydrogenase [Candidatus Omnitrophota bacterium]
MVEQQKRRDKRVDLEVAIGSLSMHNPIMVASGTFGYGEEFADLTDIKELGAVISKSVTVEPWQGNKPPRVCETTAGMLNAIGLQNDGIDDFLKHKLPVLREHSSRVVLSIAGKTPEEYRILAEKVASSDIDALEINISCPNVQHRNSSRLFAQDPVDTEKIVACVKEKVAKPIIVKLSPNVTDISEIAKAAEAGGASAVSLINTVLGMAVDVNTKEPMLGNIKGGLSGPAIKPIALRMVWEAYNAVNIPIIGIGGIMNAYDALEFIICGASAVQVGTANFVYPNIAVEIIEGIKAYLKHHNIADIKSLVGSIKI